MSAGDNGQFESHLGRFRLESFRPGQKEVVRAVLDGEDCLCIMPTGGGKSLCFQLPAVARNGLTLVVSPLIALMKDQVDSLCRLGISAALINSTLTSEEQSDRIGRMEAGQYDLVYVAPERFRSQMFVEAVKQSDVRLLAVDEAHCISQWGHDFRRDYARLGAFRRRVGDPQTIALTATATADVREDIVKQLGLKSPLVFVAGFARPNLHYQAQTHRSEPAKNRALLEFLRETPGSGIIYASTRKRCEAVAEEIGRSLKRGICVYHAGLEPGDRRRRQEEFMSGKTDLVVATNAFGMGIDKADVRFVVHYNMPGTLEAYYQEAGRAGRDGNPARLLLLYSPSDRYIQEFFIESAYPTREAVGAVYDFLRRRREDPIEITQLELKDELDLTVSTEGIGTCEQLLEKAGALERLQPYRNMAVVQIAGALPTLADLLPPRATIRRKVLRAVEKEVGDRRGEKVYVQPHRLAATLGMQPQSVTTALRQLDKLDAFDYIPPFRGRAIHMRIRDLPLDDLDLDFESLQERRQYEYRKLEQVIRFARGQMCRQQVILQYFGDDQAQPCGHCDNCQARGVQAGVDSAVQQDDTAAADVFDDELIRTVRIALSGIARVQNRYPNGGFGKTVVVGMLCGSKAAQIVKWKFDQLSTFGLLAHLRQTDVAELIEALLDADLAEQVEVERYRPVIRLTERGVDVMQQKAALDDRLIVSPELTRKICPISRAVVQSRKASPEAVSPAVEALLDSLRRWRNETADELGVPRFRVLTNKTLEQIASTRPTAYEQLETISGIGPATMNQFGDQILGLLTASDSAGSPTDSSSNVMGRKIIEQSVGSTADTEPGNGERETPGDNEKPPYYWTWRVLKGGFSLDECAGIRRIPRRTVVDHISLAIDNGLPVQVFWVLSPEQVALLEKIVGPDPQNAKTGPIGNLPPGISAEQVELFLKCRGIELR